MQVDRMRTSMSRCQRSTLRNHVQQISNDIRTSKRSTSIVDHSRSTDQQYQLCIVIGNRVLRCLPLLFIYF
jgi:hypothetical protein